MSNEKKKKPSFWRIAIVLVVIVIIGYFIYAATQV